MADSTVTTIPTMNPTTIALVGTTMVVPGRSMPIALIAALRPIASTTPETIPMTEEMMPTSTDSPSTWRITCARLAPIARSSAISRVRWATTIEKVL